MRWASARIIYDVDETNTKRYNFTECAVHFSLSLQSGSMCGVAVSSAARNLQHAIWWKSVKTLYTYLQYLVTLGITTVLANSSEPRSLEGSIQNIWRTGAKGHWDWNLQNSTNLVEGAAESLEEQSLDAASGQCPNSQRPFALVVSSQ